ncbi:MAG: chemotaxis protein CheW [Verrucomicrobiota bacterium]
MANRQFITFYLDQCLFGIDILLVREINRNLDITPVDLAPEYVRGLLNLRGQIVTVVDLGVRLELGARNIQSSSSCIILKTNTEIDRARSREEIEDTTSQDLVGLLVDRIGDVVSVDSSMIEPPPTHTHGVSGHFLSGVIKLEKQLLVTLKTSKILSLEEEAALAHEKL